jgi:glycosyltransferase involved in cell wall biosynthesis
MSQCTVRTSSLPQNQIHLAIICNEYPPLPHGGIGSFSKDLAEAMVANGHAVTVLGIAPQNARRPVSSLPDLKFCYIPPFRFRLPWALAARWERFRLRQLILARNQQTPFHLLEFPDYEGWLPYGGPANVPTITRLHGSNLIYDSVLKRTTNPLIAQFERRSLSQSDYWLGVSQFAYDKTLQLLQLTAKNGTIIHNSIDTDHFSPAPDIKTEPGLILFVNTVGPRKGIDTLLLAFNEVHATQPEARLVIIGGEPKCPDFLLPIMAQISSPARARIEFLGHQDRQTTVLNWLRRASVCCFPSRVETFGLAPLEAMSVGKPTIFTHNGPGPEIIEDGVDGLLCDPESPTGLARLISRILDNQPFADRLGTNARTTAVSKFSRKKMLQQNLACYHSMISGTALQP